MADLENLDDLPPGALRALTFPRAITAHRALMALRILAARIIR